jgi:hypothetical protein
MLQFYQNINISDYEKCFSKECHHCNSTPTNLYNTFDYKLKKVYKMCILCNMIFNFKKEYTNKLFFVKSKLTQKKINKKSMKFYDKNSYMILPIDLDKNCKLIKLSPFLLFEIIIEHPEYFTNYKIMFNNNAIIKKTMSNIFIDDCVDDDTISKYDVSYYSLNVYKFDDLEIKFINEFNKHKLTLSQSFKKSIADKLKDI